MDLTVASELLLQLSDRYVSPPFLVLGGEAALPNALADGTAFFPIDVREQNATHGDIIQQPITEGYGGVFLAAPPDRDLLRRFTLIAYEALQPGGRLVICGANAEGGKTAIKDAQSVFGDPMWSGYREKHRMAIFIKGEFGSPSWVSEPGVAPGTWNEFSASTPAGDLPLQTQAGVFPGAKLDAGTQLLLENLQVSAGEHVLDLGCGAGVIGITAAKLGAGSVTMTDASLLAVETARRNAARLNIATDVLASDVYSHLGNRQFDLIISNPPFHLGKKVDLSVANRLVEEAPSHLHQGGTLVIVANAFLNYHKQMGEEYADVSIVEQTPQYQVIRGVRR